MTYVYFLYAQNVTILVQYTYSVNTLSVLTVAVIVTVGPMESLPVIIHPVVSVLILHYQLPGVNIVT